MSAEREFKTLSVPVKPCKQAQDEVDESDDCDYTFTDFCTYYLSEPETLCGHVIFFGVTVVLLVLVLMFCPICIWGVLFASCVLCLRYRSVNLVLWACILVMWIAGWRLNFGKGLSLQWN